MNHRDQRDFGVCTCNIFGCGCGRSCKKRAKHKVIRIEGDEVFWLCSTCVLFAVTFGKFGELDPEE